MPKPDRQASIDLGGGPTKGLTLVAPPQPMDEARLVAAVAEGDTRAAGALYDFALPAVSRILKKVVGPSDPNLEDLIQISMVELITTLHRFRGECPLERWAARVAANAAYKHLRSQKLERRTFDSASPEMSQVAGSEKLERNAICRGLAQRIRERLSTLEPTKAMTFLLHDVCGHDLREVAEITGGSVAAVQSRLVRGRRELHALIAADPELAQAMTEIAEVLR